MSSKIDEIISHLPRDEEGIFCSTFENTSQQSEIKFREAVASQTYDNYLKEIANHHSVEVMDYEVRRVLKYVPKDALIIDVGGCWGWHWRMLSELRPDVKVVIVDFVKANFQHAFNILGTDINKSVYLVHGDASHLDFPDDSFDLYWSVQTLQHIPDFVKCIEESSRVLKDEGIFLNFSLNHAKAIEKLYRLLGKSYVVEGQIGEFYMSRATSKQAALIEKIFGKPLRRRFTEVLFHPDLRLKTGEEKSLWGKLDAQIGVGPALLGWIARQQTFETFK